MIETLEAGIDGRERDLDDYQELVSLHVPRGPVLPAVQRNQGDAVRSSAVEPDSAFAFLRLNQAFSALGDDVLRIIVAKGEIVTYPLGSHLFQIGEPCWKVFAVKSGSVEIQRPDAAGQNRTVAVLGPGDMLGEMAVFSAGAHRSNAIIATQGEVLVLDSHAFAEILLLIPTLALRLCRSMARRLESVVSQHSRFEWQRHALAGNLRFFDLSTILQSLMATDGLTGTLAINSAPGKVVASLSIEDGRIVAVRCGELKGLDAFYQLFEDDLADHDFTFRASLEANLTPQLEVANHAAHTLLLEAVRLADESRVLRKSRFQDLDRSYERASAELVWNDTSTLVVARALWTEIEKPRNLAEILAAVARNRYSVLSVLAEMLDTGMAR